MAEKLTLRGLVVGLIPDEEPEPVKVETPQEKTAEPVEEKPKKGRPAKK